MSVFSSCRILGYVCVCLLSCCRPELVFARSVSIASGPTYGVYYSTAARICLVLKSELGVDCSVVATNGSGENLALLKEKKVQLALVQENTLEGTPIIVGVAHRDYFLVVHKGSLPAFKDLEKKKFSVDYASGTYKTLTQISQGLGVGIQPIANTDSKSKFTSFCERSSEVTFFSIGYPSDAVDSLFLECGGLSVYSFNSKEVETLSSLGFTFSSVKVNGKEVTTVYFNVFLLVSDKNLLDIVYTKLIRHRDILSISKPVK